MDSKKLDKEIKVTDGVSVTTVNTNSLPFIDNQVRETAYTSPIIIILFLLIFPPIALFFMFREKRYHKWFAYLLWIIAALQVFYIAIQGIFVLPKLQELYSNSNIPNVPENAYVNLLYPLTLIVVEVFAGFVLYKKINREFVSYKNLLILTIGILIFGYVFGFAVTIYSIVLPVYNLTNIIQ